MTAYFGNLYVSLAGIIKIMNGRDKREALRMYKDKLYISSCALCQSENYSFKWWS